MKDILLTGGLGFIGGRLLTRLLGRGLTIYLLVRPGRELSEGLEHEGVRPVFVDLADEESIRRVLEPITFDTVFHIGALLGRRRFDEETFKKVNIESVEILGELSIEKRAKMVFCSSVGVFGAIPKQLPVGEESERVADCHYHYTKIEAEKRLSALKERGLEYVIIRPAITYGEGDFGFPLTLIGLVDRGLLFLCSDSVLVHLTNNSVLAEALEAAACRDLPNGSAYIIVDREPVEMGALADCIAEVLGKKRGYRRLPGVFFRVGEFVAGKVLRNAVWRNRFGLLSRSWYYDVSPAVRDLNLALVDTLESIKEEVTWYKNK
jgi:nucleoside-diphosphate-sugar epimerase